MTQDEIIEIVREVYGTTATEQEIRFAKMVSAAEREACAKVCEEINSAEDYYGERTELICAEAIRARR